MMIVHRLGIKMETDNGQRKRVKAPGESSPGFPSFSLLRFPFPGPAIQFCVPGPPSDSKNCIGGVREGFLHSKMCRKWKLLLIFR